MVVLFSCSRKLPESERKKISLVLTILFLYYILESSRWLRQDSPCHHLQQLQAVSAKFSHLSWQERGRILLMFLTTF